MLPQILSVICLMVLHGAAAEIVPVQSVYRVTFQQNTCKQKLTEIFNINIGDCSKYCTNFGSRCNAFDIDQFTGDCVLYKYSLYTANCSVQPMQVWERL